ncbi:uncharacterized protein BYT42DRAFT_286389 [Radiomyces spectabilis]|uniref:uncharacterized protein n=1 Tax=Radiomyces spectabilis TaxID=64574 RepID=UPI00221F8E8A|nr:uncharacterized protein BYT42DRAFT_286389 [Radiomyces spectabilis]KAI8380931.1 hypothetical protein BYT42DRAFT_286389 [Radiomyces spectabilis]
MTNFFEVCVCSEFCSGFPVGNCGLGFRNAKEFGSSWFSSFYFFALILALPFIVFNTMSSLPSSRVEAIKILKDEADRRINDIRQRVEFVCSSLRAQGNMQVNQLLRSVRQLSMEEYCNSYGADTQLFLKEQMRKRKLGDFRAEAKSRSRTKRVKSTSVDQSSNFKSSSEPRSSIDTTTSTSSSSSRDAQSTETTTRLRQQDTKSTSVDSDASRNQPVMLGNQQREQSDAVTHEPTEASAHNQESAASASADESNNEEYESGPIFVHLARSNHPRVAIQLDPQQELESIGHFELKVAEEMIYRLSNNQRRRLRDQIDDIQEQLDKLRSYTYSTSKTAKR